VSNRRVHKTRLFDEFARIGKAVAAGNRLEMLDILAQAPRTVDALAELSGSSVANASRNLQVLRAARLVETVKRGTFVEYRIASPDVVDLCRMIRQLAAARLAEVEDARRAYFGARASMDAVAGEELFDRIRAGEVTVVDVRPAEEHAAGHLPGALSIPLAELRKNLPALSKKTPIVAYCRGPYCVLAVQAVELLRKQGFEAVRLEDGIHEWRSRGFAVERAREEVTT